MAISKVVVVDGNNLTVRIDRGVAGRGITDVQPVEIDNALYLEFFFSDGTTETVGPVGTIQYIGESPIVVNAATISLSTVPVTLGGTNATTAAGARTNLNAANQDTTISAGTGLSGGGSLAANRTISIANTAVTAGSYGAASKTLTATVNAQGQLTALADTPIAIANTQISGLGTMSTQNANAVAITGGSITGITDLAIADGGTGASTAADARTNLGLGTAAVLNAGVANGVATLDAGGTVPLSQIPASIQGGVSYQGSWNAATNTPTIVSSVGTKGHYYVVSVAGSTNINGITDWLPGDWIIFNGSVWEQIDNTDTVQSVNGYVGAVVLTAADVGAPPTTRTITAGTGLSGGGDLSANRTINIANTAVTAGSYGTASSVPSITVNAQGQLTAASNTTIAIANTQVSGLGTMSTQNANSVAITGGTINGTAIGGTTAAAVSATTLTTSSTVTLNGGTANGVAYLNGSKVLTSGGALTFDGTKLTVTNAGADGFVANSSGGTGFVFNASVSSAIAAFLSTSSGEAGRITLNGTSMTLGSVGAMPFTIAGTEQMRLTSTGLGIGTSNPATKLVVSNAGALGIEFDPASGAMQVYNRSTSAYGTMNLWANTLYFRTGVSPAINMALDSSGNLGIGTSSPAQKLDVAGGNIQVRTGYKVITDTVENYGAALTLNAAGSLPMYFALNGTAAMTLSTAGNLGIGTSSPTSKLQIGSVGATGYAVSAGLAFGDGTRAGALNTDASGVTLYASTNLIFAPGSTEKMRITATGEIIRGASAGVVSTGGSVLGIETLGGTTAASSIGQYAYATTNAAPFLEMGFSRNATIGSHTVVNNGDVLGAIRFSGSDGTNFIRGAQIAGFVDGTPGTNDMPGGLYFSTTADGASTPSIRMALNASGNLGIGTSSPGARLHVGAGRIFLDQDYQLTWQNAGTNRARIYGDSGNNLVFENGSGNTERMRIDSTGNVGIGTSSPANKLVVNIGSGGGTDGIYVYGGFASGTSPAIYLGHDGTHGTDAVIKSNASTGNLEITPRSGYNTYITSGNLGLGVTPSAWSAFKAFEISAAGNALWSAGSNDIRITTNHIYNLGDKYVTTGRAAEYIQTAGTHQWYTAPSGTAGNAISFTQAMTLAASGGLSVGTTTDAGVGNINISGSYKANGVELITSDGSANYIKTGSALYFQSGSTTRVLLDSNGNLMVGTTSAAGKISIGGAGANRISMAGSTGTFYVGFDGSSDSLQVASNTSIVFQAGSGYPERARITSAGDLLVGTTSTDIWTGSATNTGFRVESNGTITAARSGFAAILAKRTTSDGNVVEFARGTAQVGSVSVTATNTTYNTSSDYRLKNITGPITNSGAYIDSLNPVEGTWKADGSTFVGLIAHEVQEASRTPVATGVKDGEEMQGMDYSSAEIIANLIAEVKSLRQRLAAAGI